MTEEGYVGMNIGGEGICTVASTRHLTFKSYTIYPSAHCRYNGLNRTAVS